MSRKGVRIERIAPPADQHARGDGEPLRPRRWGQLGYLVAGAARDLRRNRLTTSATLLPLSLSLALYGAVVLANEQLQLMAPSSINPARDAVGRDRAAAHGRPSLAGPWRAWRTHRGRPGPVHLPLVPAVFELRREL